MFVTDQTGSCDICHCFGRNQTRLQAATAVLLVFALNLPDDLLAFSFNAITLLLNKTPGIQTNQYKRSPWTKGSILVTVFTSYVVESPCKRVNKSFWFFTSAVTVSEWSLKKKMQILTQAERHSRYIHVHPLDIALHSQYTCRYLNTEGKNSLHLGV